MSECGLTDRFRSKFQFGIPLGEMFATAEQRDGLRLARALINISAHDPEK